MADQRVKLRLIDCLAEQHGPDWALYRADCVAAAKRLPDASIGLSVFSPPFSNLFVYSDSIADMGNCVDDAEFYKHYAYLAEELLRITKPGRECVVHCSDLPMHKWKHGEIGLRDFSGELIRKHQEAGWIYHSRVTIRKSPVTEMTRTKSIGLLYKQLRKNSSMSRVGMPDYLLVFRKPGECLEPVPHDADDFPLSQWQEWAEPVWMDINMSDTLNTSHAKAADDERHIAPLQLGLIRRAVLLWSNPGDVVFSPFAGIGSEGYVAIGEGRRFLGVELKQSYFDIASINLEKGNSAPPGFFSVRGLECEY
jgi:hypothetical protein